MAFKSKRQYIYHDILERRGNMPRLKLDHKKEYIQLVIDPEDKAALEAWWAANDTSMSDVMQEIASVRNRP